MRYVSSHCGPEKNLWLSFLNFLSQLNTFHGSSRGKRGLLKVLLEFFADFLLLAFLERRHLMFCVELEDVDLVCFNRVQRGWSRDFPHYARHN